MTTDKAPVTVEQGDRLAAADLLDELSSLLDHVGIGQVADLIRDGEYDEHEATEAFARFRLLSVAALEEEIAQYRTLLARWVEWSCGQQGPSPFHDTRTALEGRGS
ncbi:hypothetical protein [Sphingobium sp. YC-XJ3]|uniref:hypothetical protein n=1 Tax=Sphingobium sp. YC-XJ3 TaxID=3024245 RepID=UPI002360ED8B|nr:hypothetical protein [Sphingobium sp. YC-XJ3]WDA37821.1 hypothetical protein PO876_06480 [Sphingobium sp. YC-XJ3]